MNIYVDTSVLVSSYSADTNSVAAARLLESTKGVLWVTRFTELEFINALGLRTFRKQISPAAADVSHASFERDLSMGIFQLKPMPETAFVRARQLSRETTPQMGTRTSDLLHVAAALELGVEGFFTFDRQQTRLAETMKLKINPLP